MYMIRGQSLWACQCPQDALWTWQKLMKLRDSFHSLIQYKVDNGEQIFTWLNNWHEQGPLVKRYGDRLIYDLASSSNSRLSDFISNGVWSFSHPTSINLHTIVCSLPPLCNEDKITWGPTASYWWY